MGVEVIAVVARGTGAISGLNRMGLRSHAGAGLERQQAKRTIAKVEGGDLAIRVWARRFPPFNDGGYIQRKAPEGSWGSGFFVRTSMPW